MTKSQKKKWHNANRDRDKRKDENANRDRDKRKDENAKRPHRTQQEKRESYGVAASKRQAKAEKKAAEEHERLMQKQQMENEVSKAFEGRDFFLNDLAPKCEDWSNLTSKLGSQET